MTRNKEYRTVNITRLFMKVVGLWYVETPRERLLLRCAFSYAVWAIVFAILVEGVDLYHCIGDFNVSDVRRSHLAQFSSVGHHKHHDYLEFMLFRCNFILSSILILFKFCTVILDFKRVRPINILRYQFCFEKKVLTMPFEYIVSVTESIFFISVEIIIIGKI